MTGSGGSRRFFPAEEAGEEVGSCRATQLNTSALSSAFEKSSCKQTQNSVFVRITWEDCFFFLNSRLLNIDETTVNLCACVSLPQCSRCACEVRGHLVGSGCQTRVVSLGDKPLYLLSHLTDSEKTFKKMV